jgi:hypothetical protein
MHKGVILIVTAVDADDAKLKAEEFLGDYQDNVWDWYAIGGRWSGTLNPIQAKFMPLASKLMAKKYKVKPKELMLTQDRLNECADELKALWEKVGGTGNNPFARDITDQTSSYDIIPLSQCATIVTKWKRDLVKEANKAFRQLCIQRKKEREARKRGDGYVGSMSGYYAGIYKDAIYDDFSFDSNTYDIDRGTNDPTFALAKPDGCWVIMVDLHN